MTATLLIALTMIAPGAPTGTTHVLRYSVDRAACAAAEREFPGRPVAVGNLPAGHVMIRAARCLSAAE